MTTTIYNGESKPIHEVSAFVFSETDMGDASITCDIYVPVNIDPGFALTWYIDYKGERFYLSTRQPPAIKDTSSDQYKYSLTFKSEREDLKRYDMLDLVKSNEDDLIPDKYSFSFQGDIVQFVDRFNANLQYNFGARWEMRLADGVTSESVVVSCQDGVTMWNLLTQVYDLYGIRWHIAAEGDTMVIFVGYEPTEIEHIFEYDPDKEEGGVTGGLYSIERVNPLSDIYTRMRGTGGTKNLPYRYFKPLSQVSSEQQYPADPDYNAVIANNNYTNLMPKCFRDYLKGWNGTALSPETSAYRKGKTDKITGKFILVDYVTSDKESKWGVKYGGLQANEEIYPTIEGVWDATLGRLDEIVAVSDVVNDVPEEVEDVTSDATVPCEDIVVSNLQERRGSSYGTYKSGIFEVGEESTIQLVASASWTDCNNLEVYYDTGSTALPITVTSISLVKTDGSQTYTIANELSNPRGYMVKYGPVPAGEYYIEVKCSAPLMSTNDAYHATLTISNILLYKYVEDTSTGDTDTDDRIFYVWIKDVGFDLREEKYWAIDQGDMAVMFSDGWLAGEDYEFTIAAEKADDKYTTLYIEEDTSKSIETTNEQGEPITVNSKWKIGLIRSDAEYEASGRYLPNTVVNAKAGDHFFFVNIQLPQQYVEWAEERLQDYMDTELSKVDDEYPTFTIQPSAIFCQTFAEADKLRAGARIRIRNQRLIGDGYLVVYITSISLTHSDGKYLPQWDVVVSETPSASQNAISLLQGQVQQLSQDVYTSRNAIAEAVAQMDRLFLRSDGIADTSYSPTTFARPVTMGGTVRSTDFTQAGFAGSGWGIYKDANGKTRLEIDNIDVRGEINVNEITVNQIEFLTGKIVYSRGGISVTNVEQVTDGYKLFYDTKNGDRMNPFKVHDLAYSQNFNDPDGNIVKYYWALVTEVGEDYIVVSSTQKDGSGIPAQGDNVAQLGNTEDASRQSAFIIDQTAGGMNVQYNRLGDATAPGGMWSFEDRAMVGFGYDPEDGKAKLFCYGDAYIGNRDLSKGQYVTYQQREGDTEPKVYISGRIEVGAGSTGLTNMTEWAEKQQQIDDAGQAASDAQNTANSAQQSANEAAIKAQEAKDYIDNTLPDELATINDKLDGVVENWFYPYTPTLDNEPAVSWIRDGEQAKHVGDTFTNTQAYVDDATTPDAGKSWRWIASGSSWIWTPIADSDAVKALQQAAKAQDTADSKRRVFVVQPTPPYEVGDMWAQGPQGDTLRCIKARSSGAFDATDWDKASKYTDDTVANEAKKDADEAKKMEFSSINIIDNSESVTVFGGDNNFAFTALNIDGNVYAGESLTLSVESIEQNVGNIADGYAVVIYTEDLSQSISLRLFLTQQTKYVTFSIIDGIVPQKAKLLVYAGINGATAGNTVTYKKLMLIRGNKPSISWAPSPADVQAEIDQVQQTVSDLDYLTQVFPNSLDVNGVVLAQMLGVKSSTAADAAVVAGFYGGSDETLNAAGFKDPTHGILMMFAGAQNVQSVASAKTRVYGDGSIFTQMLYANGGKIGGFTISDYSMQANTYIDPNSPNSAPTVLSSLYMSADLLRYTGTPNTEVPVAEPHTMDVRIGTSTQPGVSGLKCPVHVQVSTSYPGARAAGLFIDVQNTLGIGDDSNAAYGSHAIMIAHGDICGLRLRTRRVDNNTQLSDYDNVILCVPGSTKYTITLPTEPQDGHVLIIKSVGGSYILKIGAYGQSINKGLEYRDTTWDIGENGRLIIMVFDKVNKVWHAGHTNWN